MIPDERSATTGEVAKADLHCHSTASQESRLGVQRSAGLPECATPPQELYELAKRRGMDFVTITDHDTIAGCLEIADRPDVFISEELTARFAGEQQAVHVLCYGITPGDHEWLQAHAGDVEACAAYLHEREIFCALAHPFYNVGAPLTPRHRRRLAELFDAWEVRNGSRAAELNMPAVVYIETHGGTGVAGSDDHAGVDIGRTWTEVRAAATPEELLRRLREGEATPCGEQGSAAKWAHAALALATRALASDGRSAGALDPTAVLRMAERVISEGARREGDERSDIGPEDARALLDAWLDSVDLEVRGAELIALLQSEEFRHASLHRRAKRSHERRLRLAVEQGSEALLGGDSGGAFAGIFASLVPAIPYASAATFLGGEKARLAGREGPARVALIADGIEAMHGVTRTIAQIREHDIPGCEVEVIGTDRAVDRRLPVVAELDVPFYEEMTLGVPSLADLAETLAEGRYDLIHVTAPGPSGIASVLLARMAGVPLVGSYHTELAAYAGLRTGDGEAEKLATIALGAFYRAPEVVLSPSPASDRSLEVLGVPAERIARWERGVDAGRFHPGRAKGTVLPGEIRVLYAGRLTREKGIDLLAESFLRARRFDPRLHLLLAGGGGEEEELRRRLGDAATFLGWLDPSELAAAYAGSDVFLFCSQTDTYGQVVVEAGASGLPVVAVDAGGPATLVADRVSGMLCPPDADRLAGALLQLAASPRLRRRLGEAGRTAAARRSWPRAMEQLAAGYGRAVSRAASDAPAVLSEAV